MFNFMMLLLALTLPPIGDVRNLEYDATVKAAYAGKWARWTQIYTQYQNWQGAKINFTGGPIQAAAEYRCYDKPDYPALQAAGYNAILLLFDTNDDVELMNAFAVKAKCSGFRLLLAYSPVGEKMDVSVFPDPLLLESRLTKLAGWTDLYIVGWRRTSVHMFRQDKAYTSFMIASIRKVAPNVPICGEIFVGETNEKIGSYAEPVFQIPPEANTVIAVNFAQRWLTATGTKNLTTKFFQGRILYVIFPSTQERLSEYKEAGVTDFIIIRK